MHKRAAVIGGGISGIQASLDIANAGYEVFLIEKEPSLGGHMAQLSETFPTLDCSQCILTPRMVEAKQNPNIQLLTYTEVTDISGTPGEFLLTVVKKPRYVIEGTCNSCGECTKVCPVVVPNEFDRGLTSRRAIYIPFPQAVPSVYTLDSSACLGMNPLICGKCKQACEPKAIDYEMPEVTQRLEVGAVVLATGYELIDPFKEYGFGRYEDVLDGLEFERLLSASGPTSGEVLRPSDRTVPKDVVFIQCVGSRDPEHGMPYCSKICCMYTAKHAMLYKHKVHDGNAYIFYMDVRVGGKNYREFVHRAVEEGVKYVRGRVARVFLRGKKLIVWGVDTMTGARAEVAADMVVLSRALVPNDGAVEFAKRLGAPIDDFGFLEEADRDYATYEGRVPGFYLAGCAHAPKDIPDSVMQASAAAGKVISFLASLKEEAEPQVALSTEP